MADNEDTRRLRRDRIAEALRTAKKGESIGLTELAKVWGVGKPAFVNVRDRIADFPAATQNGNVYVYPRLKALQALDRYERRADDATAAKQARLAKLVGVPMEDSRLSLSDLIKANQLQADIDNRIAAQKLIVPKAAVQSTAAKVFERLSRTLSDLGTVVDPNGQFTTEVRAAADKAGKELLLRIHADLKDMLSEDARTPGSPRDRSAAGRARGDGSRRSGGAGVA